jgi:hypothetical protein
MAGLVPAIHVFSFRLKTWMRGSSPRMTSAYNAGSEISPLAGRTAAVLCDQLLELKMRSGDMALRLSIVFSVAGFIALAAGLYEIDRREKSSSATAAANLVDMEQRLQILADQIRVLSDQSAAQQTASERRFQALTSQIQALGAR